MEIINIKNISKKYGDTEALKDVSLDINEGELFGLLGINGAGKTTLIKILCGLCEKTSGEAYINGLGISDSIDEIKKITDISPQETSVAPNLTVKENLEFFADIYGTNNPEHINKIVSDFALSEVLSRKAKTLSGGWQRRLSIAISLISSPKIIFLDEPTLGLDVIARRELWKIIEGLKGKTTIILTSHYLEEIQELCDRVAILSQGKLLKVGTVDELKEVTGKDNFEDAFVSLVEGGGKE